MEQFRLQFLEEALPSDNVLLRFTFKAAKTWEESAHFWKNDCFECLSPHIKVSEHTRSVCSASIAA